MVGVEPLKVGAFVTRPGATSALPVNTCSSTEHGFDVATQTETELGSTRRRIGPASRSGISATVSSPVSALLGPELRDVDSRRRVTTGTVPSQQSKTPPSRPAVALPPRRLARAGVGDCAVVLFGRSGPEHAEGRGYGECLGQHQYQCQYGGAGRPARRARRPAEHRLLHLTRQGSGKRRQGSHR